MLAEQIIGLMHRLSIPNGLQALGFSTNDIDKLVEGAIPQHRSIFLFSALNKMTMSQWLFQGAEALSNPHWQRGTGKALPTVTEDLVKSLQYT